MSLFSLAFRFAMVGIMIGTQCTFAKEILVRSPKGECFVIQVQPEESFLEVIEKINGSLDLTKNERKDYFTSGSFQKGEEVTPKEMRIDYMLADLNLKRMGKAAVVNARDYSIVPTDDDKKTITYIVTTLANKTIPRIALEQKKLKKEGDKIYSLHPFRFCEVIFTNEKLNAAMASIKGREWVWPKFKKGLFDSLTEESKRQNLKLPDIQDFSNKLGIKSALIIPSLQQGNWDEFLNILIENVPKDGNPSRYNM